MVTVRVMCINRSQHLSGAGSRVNLVVTYCRRPHRHVHSIVQVDTEADVSFCECHEYHCMVYVSCLNVKAQMVSGVRLAIASDVTRAPAGHTHDHLYRHKHTIDDTTKRARKWRCKGAHMSGGHHPDDDPNPWRDHVHPFPALQLQLQSAVVHGFSGGGSG